MEQGADAATKFVSFAQNGEDIVLARALPSSTGFYVDVGAWDPDLDSVTKHFYDRGWRGINVEPIPELYDKFEVMRPRDINVHAAVSAHDGEAVVWKAPPVVGGHSTLDESVAVAHMADDQEFIPLTVRSLRLATLLDQFVPSGTEIDFLKVDVEGHEGEVLRSNDWDRWRPKVIVVECMTPHVSGSTHSQWEPLLLDAGYEAVLFDGLNRFYVESGSSLAPLLSAPANILDPFDRDEIVRLRAAYYHYEAAFQAADEWVRSLTDRVLWLENRLSVLGAQADESSAE
jgi:FkbM family methyltransferase